MFLFFRSYSGPLSRTQQQLHISQIHLRTYVDGTINWVRDRGLDHAVEREKNLLPVMNIKDFIKSEPSKSVPVSIITQKREILRIPMRPIDLIRKYPSIFEEFLPGGIGVQPHVKLTSKVLELDAEEQLTYQTSTCRQQAADRLLKLLMLSRVHKVPVSIIDQLKWDLGLPKDFVQSIVPEFPDYFKVVGRQNFASGSGDMRVLELVCWNNELATSVLEKMAAKVKHDTSKRMDITFPMKYSNGFEMDKKFKKWVDEWQKLPYISPYENASHLSPNSDESDKWTVAILHELLHMLVTKKTEKENILCIGEYFGLRSRFKRALLHHPGIFYISSKAGTYTVVLKEGYKRGSVVESNPLMNIRNKYLHLMNTVEEDSKTTTKHISTRQQKQEQKQEQKEGSDDAFGVQNEAELLNSSDDEDEDEDEDENTSSPHTVRADPRDNVRADLRDNVRADRRDHVRADRGDQVRADRGDHVRADRGDHVRADRRDHVRADRRDHVRADRRDHVRADRRDHVRADRRDQVRADRRDQVRADRRDHDRADRRDHDRADRRDHVRADRRDHVRADRREHVRADRRDHVRADRRDNVSERHFNLKENATRSRVTLPKRMNAERPRDVTRERTGMSKRHSVRTEV
ncbi:protein WHAT'S THIS FACTOR 9, mitochondrial isoform X4 [Cucumis melo]|uniref:Protein WHAT'S THIS FACTOR 9, mitochondrial isoform X4 n=1 Tax=Cucumis melo TaxID=3656 RepID=A0ABM3KBH5_CUCME|nr:protein WHAT'S THIS FACTOR 9, mitochondrial isoform X4 [Cucumis melo]